MAAAAAAAAPTKAPQDYFCPVTREIMQDPVQTADGETYERRAIESWFGQGKNTSPMTNAKLASSALTPNKALKRSITTFLEEQVSRVKELEGNHIAAYRELRSYGPAAAQVLGDDEDWFEKGRERLRSALTLTDSGKAEADAMVARLQQLEREQIGMHNALQQLEAAKSGGGSGDGGDGGGGGVLGWLGGALWLLLELLLVLGLLIAPLGSPSPHASTHPLIPQVSPRTHTQRFPPALCYFLTPPPPSAPPVSSALQHYT
jgi:hypothetical protein